MGDNKGNDLQKTETAFNTGTGMQDCTLSQRNTMRDGLHILARLIARAHLGQQAERNGAPALGPPPAGESRD